MSDQVVSTGGVGPHNGTRTSNLNAAHHMNTTRLANAPVGEIHHLTQLSEHIGALNQSNDYSDIELIVEGQAFKAHKIILASRSEYFRALLFGGLRETAQASVALFDTGLAAFKVLLQYIYTGKVSLASLKEDLIIEVLGLAHQYGFGELENAVSDYLKAILRPTNLCTIFGTSHLYSLTSLANYCLEYADRNATEVLKSTGFSNLHSTAVDKMLCRDSFCAPEIDIFNAVREWALENADADAEEIKHLVSHIRLPLMSVEEMLYVVRPSDLIHPDRILDAIKEQTEKKNMDLNYRGCLMPGINIATQALGAQVIDGELKAALLNGDTTNYDMDRGFTRHPIDEITKGIVVQLGVQSIINHIRLLLWDRDARSYSYYVEVSMNKIDWARVVDYSQCLCRSWQELYFAPKVVKYIRVVGTNNTVNRVFHLVALEALYDKNDIDVQNGFIVPKENVASEKNNALVIEGVSRTRNALINGNTHHYDWDSGYTCHQLGSGSIAVQLPQPYLIGSARLLLWDCDDRAYSYYIEVSCDNDSWTRIVDHSKDACKSWQVMRFLPVPATFIRIVGTQNTANEVFHCVHFECPADANELDKQAEEQIVSLQSSNTPRRNTMSPSLSDSVDLNMPQQPSSSKVAFTRPVDLSPQRHKNPQQMIYNSLVSPDLSAIQAMYESIGPQPSTSHEAENSDDSISQ